MNLFLSLSSTIITVLYMYFCSFDSSIHYTNIQHSFSILNILLIFTHSCKLNMLNFKTSVEMFLALCYRFSILVFSLVTFIIKCYIEAVVINIYIVDFMSIKDNLLIFTMCTQGESYTKQNKSFSSILNIIFFCNRP